jgi:hypothetical protein
MTIRKLTITGLALALVGTVAGIATLQVAPPSPAAQLNACSRID